MQSNFNNTLPVMIVSMVLTSQGAWSDDGPSIAKIVSTLEKQREQITSLYIETTSYSTAATERNLQRLGKIDLQAQHEQHFAFKDGKRYSLSIKSTIDREAGDRHVTFNDEHGEDGNIHWERRVNLDRGPAQVFVFPFDPMSQWIYNPDYCVRIGWDCRTELNTQEESALRSYRDHDLLCLLKSGGFTIEPGTTEFEGHKCVLIRRQYETTITPEDRNVKPPLLKASQRIWLDLNLGLAMRKSEQEIEQYGLDRIVNSQFVEIAPGIWFPKKTELRKFGRPDTPKKYEDRLVTREHIDLVRWTVNDVPDQRFQIVTKPSDILVDSRTGAKRVIEGPFNLRTLEGSRDPSIPAGMFTPSVSPPHTLTEKAARLMDLLWKAGTHDRRNVDQYAVAVASMKGCDPAEPFVELLRTELSCKCDIVTATEICAGSLKKFDVILFPGGSSRKQGAELGLEGRRAIRNFVDCGGGYVGICAGGILATVGSDWTLGLVNAKTLSGRRESPGPDGVMKVDMGKRHSGIVKMELTNAGRKVLGGGPGLIDTKFALGPVFLPARRDDLSEYLCLAFYRTELWMHKLQRGTMIDSPSILAGQFGHGHVILFSSHPESCNKTQAMLIRAVVVTATASKHANSN